MAELLRRRSAMSRGMGGGAGVGMCVQGSRRPCDVERHRTAAMSVVPCRAPVFDGMDVAGGRGASHGRAVSGAALHDAACRPAPAHLPRPILPRCSIISPHCWRPGACSRTSTATSGECRLWTGARGVPTRDHTSGCGWLGWLQQALAGKQPRHGKEGCMLLSTGGGTRGPRASTLGRAGRSMQDFQVWARL